MREEEVPLPHAVDVERGGREGGSGNWKARNFDFECFGVDVRPVRCSLLSCTL